eukprot:3110733-Karenia_brevis.AAC.1
MAKRINALIPTENALAATLLDTAFCRPAIQKSPDQLESKMMKILSKGGEDRRPINADPRGERGTSFAHSAFHDRTDPRDGSMHQQ